MDRLSLCEQMNFMLDWFFENGVTSVDVHLRSPKFKGAAYSSDNWVWLTHHEDLSLQQAQGLLKWCRYKNYHGSDIYIRPFRHAEQPIIFLDDLSLLKASMVSDKYRSIVIETSPNNTQVWVALSKKLSEGNRKLVQQHIAELGFTDKGSISGEHLGRLCGFRSQKRNCWVKCIHNSYSIRYDPPNLSTTSFPRRGACVKKILTGRSQSEIDFSWVLSNARRGVSSEVLTNILASSAHAREKSAPLQYANRTVRRALKILT